MMKILLHLGSNDSLEISEVFNMLGIDRASNIMGFMRRQIKKILTKPISLAGSLSHKKAGKFENFVMKF